MNIFEMFEKLDDSLPSTTDEDVNVNPHDPTFVEQPSSDWSNDLTGFRTRPVLYNIDGYISPYASNNWGGTSNIMKSLEDVSRLPPLSDKIDPNKIFTSDISALRSQASDQIKVTKMFEKRLMESLTDRGKVGLDENDIMAMQALTSARAAVTSIQKEQIAIKKNIADIRIKQQQNRGGGDSTGNGSAGGSNLSNVDVGRSILDSIFDAPTVPVNANISVASVDQSASPDEASDLLDELIPASLEDASVRYEAVKPTTYVVVGDTSDDAEFVTYASSGEIIEDYPNPTTKIDHVDLESGVAIDDLCNQYPVKKR